MSKAQPPTLRADWPKASLKQIAVASIAVFLIALGVRLLSWHDTRLEVGKVQSGVVSDYQRTAKLLTQGGFSGFMDPSGPLADPNLLGHPPGYPIVRAFVAALFGESSDAIQLVQITGDAIAAVLIFLIALELLPFTCGLIAGLLVALAPQFAWNSVLLLPDTLSVLPLLLASYCLIRALKKPRLLTMILAGAFVGLSCWLRANGLLMAPFFALLVFVLFERGQRLRYATAVLAGAVLMIGPLTIRNWIVFHHFVPISLGAGQTMLEGISDYDPTRRFGIPDTDMGIMKMEAEQYNRPDYYSTLFAPDGVKRDRLRLARGLALIGSSPGWFLGVMIRRAGSMLRLERARIISSRPSVTHQPADANQDLRVWMCTPVELVAQAVEKSPGAEISASPDNQTLRLKSDNSKYGNQITTGPVVVEPQNDYLFRLPIKIEQGRMTVSVIGAQTGMVYTSAVLETVEAKDAREQPVSNVDLSFVAGPESRVALAFNNAVPQSGLSIVQVGMVELLKLGPTSMLWTRYPRLLIRAGQKLFITAFMLPLALLGIVVLARSRPWKSLVLLLAVPAYYLCVQSVLHTEYRYVLAIHYFLFVLAADALYELGSFVIRLIDINEAGKRLA